MPAVGGDTAGVTFSAAVPGAETHPVARIRRVMTIAVAAMN